LIPFKQNLVIVGRALDCHYTIGDALVSRRHAQFRRADGRWRVKNMSINGTLVNGLAVPCGQEVDLSLKDTVQFCEEPRKYVYKFTLKVKASNNQPSSKNKENKDLESSCICASESLKSSCDSKESNNNEKRISSGADECQQNLGSNSQLNLTATQLQHNNTLLKEHGQLSDLLQQTQAKCDQLQQDKILLSSNLAEQQQQLKAKYAQDCEQLLKEKSTEQHLAVQEKEQQLFDMFEKQMSEIKLQQEREKDELEKRLQEEVSRKNELAIQQEQVKMQLETEKERLREAFEKEKGEMEDKMKSEVFEMEERMAMEVLLVEQRLEEERTHALELERQLAAQEEMTRQLSSLENEKLSLQEQLQKDGDALKQQNERVLQLQESVSKVEEEKAELQQSVSKFAEEKAAMLSEMEMMEFAVSAEAKKSVVDSVEEVVDGEMQCPVCNELFIRPVLLGCTHTFCEYCINCWKKTRKNCPTCRAPIATETRCLAVDNLLTRIVGALSQELRDTRETTVRERQEAMQAARQQEEEAERQRQESRSRRGRGRGRRGGRSDVVLEGIEVAMMLAMLPTEPPGASHNHNPSRQTANQNPHHRHHAGPHGTRQPPNLEQAGGDSALPRSSPRLNRNRPNRNQAGRPNHNQSGRPNHNQASRPNHGHDAQANAVRRWRY